MFSFFIFKVRIHQNTADVRQFFQHDTDQNKPIQTELCVPGRIVQSVTCLANPGVASLIPAWSHTLLKIDNEVIYTVILPSSESF